MENRKFDLSSTAKTPPPVLPPTHTLRLSNPQKKPLMQSQSPQPVISEKVQFTDVFSRMNRIRVGKGQGLVSKYGLIG